MLFSYISFKHVFVILYLERNRDLGNAVSLTNIHDYTHINILISYCMVIIYVVWGSLIFFLFILLGKICRYYIYSADNKRCFYATTYCYYSYDNGAIYIKCFSIFYFLQVIHLCRRSFSSVVSLSHFIKQYV